MPKIFKQNQVLPKKKPLTSWGYTTKENGKIYRFNFPESESAFERMRQELTNVNNWGKYQGPHPEGGRGSRNFTVVRIIPDYDAIRVHSLFFPDGMVFDSTIRDFRRIRDYEKEQ